VGGGSGGASSSSCGKKKTDARSSPVSQKRKKRRTAHFVRTRALQGHAEGPAVPALCQNAQVLGRGGKKKKPGTNKLFRYFSQISRGAMKILRKNGLNWD